MLKSLIIAFSMYSKIPMPRIEWDKKSLRYVLCFFPFTGLAVGLFMLLWFFICSKAGFGRLFIACVASVIPLVVTGGIHMDGFLDTIDALNSYADMDKKLEILKDSNSGAFAIIYGIIYMLLSVGIWNEMDYRALPFICAGYIISRSFSGLSVASFPLAKDTGLAAMFKEGADKRTVRVVMVLYMLLAGAVMLYINIAGGIIVMGVSFAVFIFYYYMCKNKFGGITGDLAGFFLQVCELAVCTGLMFYYKLFN